MMLIVVEIVVEMVVEIVVEIVVGIARRKALQLAPPRYKPTCALPSINYWLLITA